MHLAEACMKTFKASLDKIIEVEQVGIELFVESLSIFEHFFLNEFLIIKIRIIKKKEKQTNIKVILHSHVLK